MLSHLNLHISLLLTVLENIEFIKKQVRLNNDPSGQALKRSFDSMVPVIVPIFDGTYNAHV